MVTTVAHPNQVLEPRSRSQNTSRFLVGVAYAVLIIHTPVNFRQEDPGTIHQTTGFRKLPCFASPRMFNEEENTQ